MNASPEEKKRFRVELDAAIHDFILGVYENWRETRKHIAKKPEPRLSVGVIKDYVEQHRLGHDEVFCWEARRTKYRLVQASLARLKRQGKIGRSLGEGDRGQEAFLYEPPQGWGEGQ